MTARSSRRSRLTPLLLAAGLAVPAVACGAFEPGFGALANPADDGAALSPDAGVVFARDIRPLMNRDEDDPAGHGCRYCHYETAGEHVGYDLSGLDLSTLGALREGGMYSGMSIVIPGNPDDSALVKKLLGTYAYGSRMPRNGPPYWSAAEIAVVRAWIAEGAKGTDDE
jgi:hypothetical protein